MANVSATGIAAYMTCARKYDITRNQRWVYDGPVSPGPMELGSLVHHLVEHRVRGEAVADMPDRADKWIVEYYDTDYSRTEALTHHKPYALAMTNYVLAWMEHERFWDTYELLDQESDYEVEVEGHTFRFRPDFLVKHRVTDYHGVLDLKTGKTLSGQIHQHDWQLTVMAVCLEELGYKMHYGGHIRVKATKTATAKPPYVEFNELRFDLGKLESARRQLVTIANRIDSDDAWLPSPSHTCPTMCAFYQPCQAMDTNQDWQYVMMQTHKQQPRE